VNWAWLDGKGSAEEEKEHPLAHEKVQDESMNEGNE